MCDSLLEARKNVWLIGCRNLKSMVHELPRMLTYVKMFCQNRKPYVNIEYGLDLIICFYESTYNIATFLKTNSIKILTSKTKK